MSFHIIAKTKAIEVIAVECEYWSWDGCDVAYVRPVNAIDPDAERDGIIYNVIGFKVYLGERCVQGFEKPQPQTEGEIEKGRG